MTKKIVIKKTCLRQFMEDINCIIQMRQITDSLVYRLWRMYDGIVIPDHYADMVILCALQSIEFGHINCCHRECILAAKCIKEVLRDWDMWNLD